MTMFPEFAYLGWRVWLREAGIYALMYGIPLVLLFPWTGFRPDADFVASLKTSSVDLTVRHYDGVGFAGGRADVSFEGIDRIEIPGSNSPCVPQQGRVQFSNVKLQAI